MNTPHGAVIVGTGILGLAIGGDLLRRFSDARLPSFHLLNVPSHAVTASLAIARRIVDEAERMLDLSPIRHTIDTPSGSAVFR